MMNFCQLNYAEEEFPLPFGTNKKTTRSPNQLEIKFSLTYLHSNLPCGNKCRE